MRDETKFALQDQMRNKRETQVHQRQNELETEAMQLQKTVL